MVKKIGSNTQLKAILPELMDEENFKRKKRKNPKKRREELEDLSDFVESGNQSLMDRNLEFELDQERLVVKLIDRQNKRVLREISLDEILDRRSGVSRSLGILVDERI